MQVTVTTREITFIAVAVVAAIVWLIIDTSWATVFALAVAFAGFAGGLWYTRRQRAGR